MPCTHASYVDIHDLGYEAIAAIPLKLSVASDLFPNEMTNSGKSHGT